MNWLHQVRHDMKKLGKTKADRLPFLIKWANFKRKNKDTRTLSERRAAYQRGNPRGLTLVGQCWCCQGWSDVFNHHIVQLQHGGTNDRLNMVRICGECHRGIHPWLPKPTEPTLHEPAKEEPPF